jgi:hypothetical protein
MDHHHLHHQLINVPTAGAQAYLMDYTWWLLTTVNAAGTNGLTCLPKHRGEQDKKILVTHPMTDQRCSASAIARRSALTAGPSNSSLTIIDINLEFNI